jgi:uncharacterized protein YxjI
MDGSKFTSRSVEVINAAHTAAVTAGNSQVEPVHLAIALLRQQNGLAPSLLTKAGADVDKLSHELDELAWKLPKATGATVQTPSTSHALTRVLAKALELAQEMKDEYVATENLLTALAIVDSPVKEALARAGAAEVATVERHLVALRPTYAVTIGGEKAADVRKHFFTPFRDKFTIDIPGPGDLEVTGHLLDHEFTIERDGDRVAVVSKRWFSLRDTYGVQVAEGEDDLLVLASVLAVELALDREKADDD